MINIKKRIKKLAAYPFYNLYIPSWNTYSSRFPLGTNILDEEWDLAIVLDSCRVDTLEKFIRDWDIPVVKNESILSVGSMSAEWILNTFNQSHKSEIENCILISGNSWSENIFKHKFHQHSNHHFPRILRGFPKWRPVSADDFKYFECITLSQYPDEFIHPQGSQIPHIITDRAINAGREIQANRMIVHYMLPHMPHIARAVEWKGAESNIKNKMTGNFKVKRELFDYERNWKSALSGKFNLEKIQVSYEKNLDLIMNYVEILLQNIDAKRTIITADHGEAIGPLIWGHPYGLPWPSVKRVPWFEVRATDMKTYSSQASKPDELTSEQTLKNLEFLGYK